ncbi:hypothetical protein MGYG_08618 [Nannizzia gypsea CBS 118893]|uniref:Uncharacterized protein n=1 Tax=Arthroderma gypseum (strain ATCC MYA-4604 / CBS 118893) TaxID=535722 RepID=E4V6H8_ARTGP|nr:hypothetical protein MGYG_08618 [Nannizzia gypsea CBS 118893]EFQ96694.1 hypothetical protein MGYG_08618 [Nannizzia gypsea CBS 118893]
MDASTLIVAGFNFTRAETFGTAVYRFVADRSLVVYGIDKFAWCQSQWCTSILEWLLRPDVLAVITAWWITFAIITTLLLTIGFGPAGIGLGSYGS